MEAGTEMRAPRAGRSGGMGHRLSAAGRGGTDDRFLWSVRSCKQWQTTKTDRLSHSTGQAKACPTADRWLTLSPVGHALACPTGDKVSHRSAPPRSEWNRYL